jgi:hypothetical protein
MKRRICNSVVYADKVLNNPKTDDNVKRCTKIIARSALQTGAMKPRAGYAKLLTLCKRRVGS